MYDGTRGLALTGTGGGVFALGNGLTMAIIGVALVATGIALYRLAPRLAKMRNK